jgi:hypothetical protein
MNTIIPIAGLVVLALGTAAFLLLRTFFSGNHTLEDAAGVMDLCWRDYRPLDRLLDPADFEFLRSRGASEVKIRKLRAERRRIYRRCLRSLAHDFNQVHRSVNMVLIQSREDRPQLAAILATQKLTFYRNLVRAEFRLMLNACGLERMPVIDLLKPLEVLQTQLRQLAVAGAAV